MSAIFYSAAAPDMTRESDLVLCTFTSGGEKIPILLSRHNLLAMIERGTRLYHDLAAEDRANTPIPFRRTRKKGGTAD